MCCPTKERTYLSDFISAPEAILDTGNGEKVEEVVDAADG